MNEPDARAVSALQTMAAPWASSYAAERSTPVEEPLATPQTNDTDKPARSER